MSFKHLSSTLIALLLMAPLVASAEPVNINTADATTLAKALNGIGPAKAKAIVSYREKNGPFKTADQLAMVDGISQKTIDKNRADIRLGNDKGGEKAADKPAPDKAPASAVPAKPAVKAGA
jgi:competence protein ComEA